MVVLRFFFLFLLAMVSPLLSLPDINVGAEVQWEDIYENEPIKGTLTVTHDVSQKINTESFKIGGKPLKVSFVKEVKIEENSPIAVTIFNFEIPGMKKGLQFLPEITVDVAGKTYGSIPSTFEVHTGSRPLKPSLILENIYEGQEPLYPGQRALIGYRYIYNTSFDLTQEVLPLLSAAHLRKVGDKAIKDYQSGNLSITEITQIVEAIKPGEYSYGPSIVAGIAYLEDTGGNKAYFKTPLSTEAPAITVKVVDFPNEGKPASFNGAVGQYQFTVELLSANQVKEGDEIKLGLTVSGNGQVENILVPDLCCQPGFSGIFKTGDLPVVGRVKDNTKSFTVGVIPITEHVTAIPSIEFSFFDPLKGTYSKILSEKISLKVLAGDNQDNALAVASPIQNGLKPIEIEGNYPLSFFNLSNHFFGSIWALALAPLGCLLLFFQIVLKQEKEKNSTSTSALASHQLFEKMAHVDDERQFYDLLEKAFIALLLEKKIITTITSVRELSDSNPKTLEVKQFFQKLDAKRFSGKNAFKLSQILIEANKLYNSIEGN